MSGSRLYELHRGGFQPSTPPHALPGDHPMWPRDRDVAVQHIKVQIALDVAGKSVTGVATHTVRALNDGVTSCEFDAIEMRIESVTTGKVAARFDYDGAKLRIHFPAPLQRGDETTVAIAYSATPRLGLYFIAPDEAYPEKPVQVWSQCQDEDTRYWIPCYDYPNQKQTTEMIATVPGNWFALSNGRLLQDKQNRDGTRTFHWHQDRPHATYLITLAAGEFSRIDASRPDLTIDYYVEEKDIEDATRSFANTPQMVALFEEVTGIKYPWAKYSQIVVRDFVFGGMENTSATTMTENLLVDAKGARDFTSDGLVSHELAHMWWGDLLTCRDWSHGWLNESFATYMECLWTEHHLGADEYRQEIIENTNLYKDERYRRPIVTNIYHEPIDLFDRHLYEKGSVVLHTLRGVLGDDPFFRSIRRYGRENQERSVITQDLINAIDAETGRNLEWFFDQWVFRPGHPELKVSWSWDEATRLATVSVRQTQKTDDGTPVYRLPVAIDFRKGRAKPTVFRVEIAEAEQTFVFPLREKPDLCRFDPYNWVLKDLDFEKSIAELRYQLATDDDVYGRQLAAASLGKKGGPEAVAALEQAVTNDRFWAVQAAAAKALGAIRTTEARDALLRSLKVRHPKARRGVVAALGEFHGDESVFAALQPLAGRDQSWFVESEANRSIGKLRCPGSLEVIRSNIGRPSFRQVVRSGCLDGLVELRDERAFDDIAECARYGAFAQSRQSAVSAMGRLGQYFPERKRRTGEAIAEFLRDPDFRVRMAAANALKTLRDEAQAGALEEMAARELDGRAIRIARENAAILRKGAGTDAEITKLRGEFESLREENGRLKERLTRLEAQVRDS
ncbi:MAG: HEAT repeat domain-containing protein [Dehalococcoidia bacterium]|nr:HEAT repeat domain-containing protein [Dehalococcoidia bacterium]